MSSADVLVVVEFTEPTSSAQQQWLRMTPVRVRRIVFHNKDENSAALLHDTSTLVCPWVCSLLRLGVRTLCIFSRPWCILRTLVT